MEIRFVSVPNNRVPNLKHTDLPSVVCPAACARRLSLRLQSQPVLLSTIFPLNAIKFFGCCASQKGDKKRDGISPASPLRILFAEFCKPFNRPDHSVECSPGNPDALPKSYCFSYSPYLFRCYFLLHCILGKVHFLFV